MIICCGEALIDMIPTPTVAGPDGFVPHTGGAVYNTAIALGRLGVECGMVTGMSSDMFGDQLLNDLRRSHVDTSRIVLSDRPTTVAFVQLVNGHAKYSFMDENSAGRMLDIVDMPVLDNTAKALFFGGISLACEPAADSYATFLERNAADRVIMVDPNIRPNFIADERHYRDRLARMLSRADIVKVSDEDLTWIAREKSTLKDQIAMLHDLGVTLVIVTKGGDGASGYIKGRAEISVPARLVSVVDTVGAGDTFNAGVLAKLSELGLLDRKSVQSLSDHALAECLSFAAHVASVTVSRAGANPPWAKELSSI